MNFRYSLLKYEDLVTSPISTLVNFYSNLRLDFDTTVADALYNHTRATKEVVNAQQVNRYYSTYRTADTDIFKWKKELPLNEIRHVEKNCNEFMQKVGYVVFKTEEIENSA